MLDKIYQHSRGWLAYVIVALIGIPFALWGIGDYLGYTSPPLMVTVDGEDITEQEFSRIYQQVRNEEPFSQILDPSEETTLKQQLLESLILQKIQKTAARQFNLNVSDDFIRRLIMNESIFQQDGKFSHAVFNGWLKERSLTEPLFIEKIKETLLQQELQNLYQTTSFATPEEITRIYHLMHQTRDIQYTILSKELFRSQLKIEADSIQAYYKNHPEKFKTDETIQVEYVELNARELSQEKITVTEAELKKYFEENIVQNTTPESIQIAHILVTTETAPILKKHLDAGGSFTKLARQFSIDAATKNNAGILGWFTKNNLPTELAETAFALKKIGAVSEPIRSHHGVHFIKLLDRKPPQIPVFKDLTSQLKTELEQEKYNALLTEKREMLATLSYEHPDSLDRVSQSLNLPIKISPVSSRQKPKGLFLSSKILTATLSDIVLHQGWNSEVIELEPKHWIVLRKKAYVPPEIRPLKAVESEIQSILEQEQLAKLIHAHAEKITQKLNHSTTVFNELKWEKRFEVARNTTVDVLPEPIQKLAFLLPNPKQKQLFRHTPLVSGDEAIVKVLAIHTTALSDLNRQKLYQQYLENTWAQLEYQFFLSDLKSKTKIKKYQ